MPITASKYINNSKLKTSYIGLYHYLRPERGNDSDEVHIYGLLSVTSKVEIPGDKICKFAWDGIVDGFEYSKLDSVNESLKLSLNEATRRVKQLISNDSNISEHGVDINFTVFISNSGGIYIGLLGEADIFVYKKGRLVDIFEMLSAKRATTAGIAVEEGDLIFSSTKGFFKENIKRLMSSKDRAELISTLDELGREVGDDQGFILLSKNRDVVKEKKVVSKEVPQDIADTDYIPVTKQEERVFKPIKEEKDLKTLFTDIGKRFAKLKIYFAKIYADLSKPLSKLNKVGDIFKEVFTKLKEKGVSLFSRKRWFKKVSSKVTQSNIVRRRSEKFKGFRIDGYKVRDTRFKRLRMLILVVLGISLILGGIKFSLNQKEALENSKLANEIFTQVNEYVDVANSKVSTDRDSSILNIYQASEQLEKLPKELNKRDTAKLEDLRNKILNIEDILYRRVRLSTDGKDIEKYLDTLTIYGADSIPSDIAIYRDSSANEYLFLSDTGLKNAYRISLYNKESKVLIDDEKLLQKPAYIYPKASGVYVLDMVNGVVKASADGNWYKSFYKPTGLGLTNIHATDISEFAVLTSNDNVYILDRGSKALLKLTNYGTGYGLSEKYLENDSFEFGNDVFSDLSVYILTKGENGINRYVSSIKAGKLVESPLTLKGLDTPLKDVKYGFTADDLNKDLFVFDVEDMRILRFEKPLEAGEIRHPNELLLVKQYVLPGDGKFNDVKDFVVDFKQEYLYLLNGTMIWKVRL